MELSQSFRKKLSNLTQFFQEMESDVATMQNDMKNDMSSSRRSPYESSVSAAGAPGNSMEGRRFDNMEEPLASDEVDQAFNSTDMPRRRSGSGSFPKEAAGKRKSGTQPGKNRNGGQSPTSVELPESQKPQVEDEKKNDISKVEAKLMLSEILRKKCSGSDLSKENCNKSNSVTEHLDRTSTQEAHSFSTSNLIGHHSDVQSQVEARKAEPIQSNESNMNIMNEEPADGLLPTRGRHLNEQYRTVLSISTKHPRVGMRTDLKRGEDGTSNVFVSSSTLHLKRNIKVADKEAVQCGENGAGTSKAAEPQFTELDGLPPCSEITTYDKTSSLSEPRSITYATYQSPRKKNRRRKSLEKKNIAPQFESGGIDSEDKQVSSPNVDRSQNDHSKLRFPSPESPMLSPKGPAKEVVIEKTELITIEENIVKKGSRNMLEEKRGRSEASSQISKVKETETKSVRNESKIDPTIKNYSDQKTPDKRIQETDGIRGFEVDASAKTLTEQSPSSTKALQTKGLSKKLSDLSNRRSQWTVDSANSNISNRVKLQKTTDVQEEQQQGPEEQQLGTEQWQPGSEKQKPEPEQQKLGPEQWKPSTEQWKPDPDQQSSLQEKQPGQEEQQLCPEEWKPGPEQRKPGPEQRQPGPEQRKPGPEQQKPGPEQRQPELEQWKQGPEEQQLSLAKWKLSPDQQPCLQEWQPGPEKCQPDLEKQQPGPEEQQPGLEERQLGPEERQPGPEQRQPGPEQQQPGPEQRQPGPEQWQPGLEQQKPGLEQWKPELEQWEQGPGERQPGPEEQQSSLEKWNPSPDWQPSLQERQPGPEESQLDQEEQQPGLEERELGLEERQPGTQEWQPGPEQRQPGPEQWKPGSEERQPGPEEHQPSPEQRKPSPDWQHRLQEWQPGSEEWQPGPKGPQPNMEEWQAGPEEHHPGPEERQPGPEDWQPGLEQQKPGPEQWNLGPELQPNLEEQKPSMEEQLPGPEEQLPSSKEWQACSKEGQAGPEERQAGLEERKPGPEQRNLGPELQPDPEEKMPSMEEQLPGPEVQLPGPKERQACPEEWQAGPEQLKPGPGQQKPGLGQQKPGPAEQHPGPVEWQPGQEQRKPGPEQQKPGPEQQKPGPEERQPGQEQLKPGPEQLKPGPEERQPGPEERQPGLEQRKPGPEQQKPGPEVRQPDPVEWQPDLEQRKPGPEQQKPGPEERQPGQEQQKPGPEEQQPGPVEWQPGQEQLKPCPEQLQLGPEERQPGLEQRKPSPEQQKSGPEQLKPGPEERQPGPEERQPGLEQRKPGPEQQKPGPEVRQPDPVEWQPDLEQRKPSPEQQKPGPEERQPDPVEWQPSQEQLKPGLEEHQPGPKERQPYQEGQEPGQKGWLPGPEEQQPGPEEQQPDLAERQPDRPKPFYSTTEFQHDPRSLPDLQDAQYDTNKMHHGLEGSFIATNLSYSSNRRETHEDNDIGIAFTVEHPKPTEPIDSDIVNSIVESQINDSPTADAFTETAKQCFDPDGNVKGKMTKVLKTGEKSDFKDSSGVKDIDLGQPAVDIMTQNTIVMEPKNPPQINGDVAVESTLDINDSPVPSEKSILPCSGPKQSQVELMEESFTFEPDSQLSPENTILKTATRIFREAQDMENRSTHSPDNLTEDLLKENGDLDQSMLPKKILAEHNDLPYFSMESKDVPRQGNDLQLPSSEHKMTEPRHSNLHYNVTQKKICNGTSTDVTGQSIHTFTTETMTDEEGHHASNKMHKGMTVNPKTFLSVKSGEDLNNTASNNGQLNATTEVSSETLQHNGSNFIFDSMEVLNTVNHPHPAVAIEEEEPGVYGGVEIVQMENDDSTLVLYTPQDLDDIYSISLDKLPTIREDVYFEEIEEGEEVYKVEKVEEEEEDEEGIAPGTKKQKYFPDTDVYEMFKEIKIPDYSEYFTPNKKDVPKTSKQRMQLGKIRPGLELQKSKPVNQFRPRNLAPSGVSSILNSVKDSSGNQQQLHEEEEGASTSTEEELHNSKVAIQGSQRSQISMYAKTRTGGIDSTREAKIEVKPGVEKQSFVQNKRLSNTLIHSDDSQGLRKQPLDIPEEENSEHQAHLHLIKETLISYPDQSQEHFDDEEREWDGSRNKNKKEAKTVSEVEKPLEPGTRNYMLMRGGNEIRDADGKMSLQKSRGLGVKRTEEVQPENRDKKQSDHKISPALQDLQIQDKKVNPRPGKIVVFSEPYFAGKQIQVFSSVPDATSWSLSSTISLQVIRGGWLVFKEPNYEGETFSLEEGECEEFCPWQKMEDQKDDHDEDGKHPIGSMKLIVNDNSLPVITLFAHPKCCGNPMVHHEEVECLELYNIRPMVTSITVQSGVWVLHHDYGFNDVIGVLEPGVYPTLESWGAVEPVLGSFYPLCMGNLKVENPNEPKVVLYEEEEFCGRSQEMCVAITELTGFLQEAGPDVPQSVGSLRVLAGLWVVYEEPGFQGRQLLLEEGEFPRPSAWGDYSGRLGSLRPICCDFGSPQLLLLEDPELEHGKELQLVAEPVADLQLFGFGTHISELEVQQGVWVAYEEANFCGEQYILERGLYRSHLDWGGSESSIGSVRPVFLHRTSEPTSESRVVLYSQKNFLGERLEVTESLKVLPDAWLGGAIASIRVLSGCWVLYSAVEFSGLEFVLEEGSYPCRDDFACPNDSQLASLHALPHNVSEPCLSMFSRPGLAGRELEVISSCRSLTELGHDGRVSSVCVHSGIWAVFEFPNFRGHQVVLESCEVPNWKERTEWSSVGSLYPLKRCQLYIRLWNSGRSGALAVAKDPLNNENLCVCLLTDEADPAQNWLYRDGILRNLECELCLEVVQEATMMPNSQLQLSGESCHTKQKWTIQPDGVISSVLDPDLLLDVKDAFYYDRNIPVVLNQRTAFRTTQKWDLQFL